jgi:hypothetical protein
VFPPASAAARPPISADSPAGEVFFIAKLKRRIGAAARRRVPSATVD